MKTSKRLTIFEGPDGSGKTTAAKDYAAVTGARYVHFANLPNVGKNLARMYVEAMLPALLGYQDVVFDRCWLSEVPYGRAFRDGQDRLGVASRRMLERLAMRCGAVVVHCRPPWERVRETYLSRVDEEYLNNEDQLKVVYDMYDIYRTELNELMYDYTADITAIQPLILDSLRMPPHPLSLPSAGNWSAPVVLIGEKFTTQKDCDAFYQWPFASFSNLGCSQWLTEQLATHNVREDQLLWLNADQDLSVLYELDLTHRQVIALGQIAYKQLDELGIPSVAVPHPQHHKRFNINEEYDLFNLLRGII
jgi:hypothetical protein